MTGKPSEPKNNSYWHGTDLHFMLVVIQSRPRKSLVSSLSSVFDNRSIYFCRFGNHQRRNCSSGDVSNWRSARNFTRPTLLWRNFYCSYSSILERKTCRHRSLDDNVWRRRPGRYYRTIISDHAIALESQQIPGRINISLRRRLHHFGCGD
jgi:hypothetical protein